MSQTEDTSARAAADRLVDALEAEGERHGEGRFRLDREAAARKLRDYQLPDPTYYVLELVQAAVARGATRISVRVDADDLEISSDGAPFTLAELSDRENALLEGDAGSAGLGCLAVGLHAALGLGPRFVHVTSGDGAKGLRLILRPGAREVLEEEETALRGFAVHVKRPISAQLVSRARQDRKGLLPEEQLLRERCRYAQASVVLEGQELAWGLCPPDAVCPVTFEGEGFRGVGAFVAGSRASSVIHLGQQGVWLETVDLGGLPNGFVAAVDAPGLRKDLSRVRFTEDEAFRAMRLSVREARQRSARALVGAIEGESGGALQGASQEWARGLVREGLRNFSHRRDFEGSFSDETAAALAGALVYRLADERHGGGVLVSLFDLLGRADRGEGTAYVLVPSEDYEAAISVAADGQGPSSPALLLDHEGDGRSLGRLLGAGPLGAPHGAGFARDERWEQRLLRATEKRRRASSDERRWTRTVGWATGLGIGGLAGFYLVLGLLAGSSEEAPEPRAERTREVKALEKACEARSGEACAQLARGYEEGRAPYPQSGARARSLYGLACMYGDEPSCARARSPAAVFSEAVSCAAGKGAACFRLAERYRLADGVVRDLRLAQRHRKEACKRGHAVACKKPPRGPATKEQPITSPPPPPPREP